MSEQRVWIGIDPGSVRCGVAAADPSGVIASPLGSVATEPRAELPVRLRSLLQHRLPCGFVIGLALDEHGNEAALATIARELAAQLSQFWDVGVTFIDERFSSREAQQRQNDVQLLSNRGERTTDRRLIKSRSADIKRSGQLDALAASVILQSFLDQHRRNAD